MERVAVTVAQAAALVGVSARTIDRATKATDASAMGVPLLKSKLIGNRRVILAADLEAWASALPEG